MATMISYSQLVESLGSRIDAQAKALAEIAIVLAGEAERCHRADQASCIDALREEVVRQVEGLQRAEESARSDFNRAKPGTSIAKAIGTGLGAWLGKNTDPILRGMEVLKKELDKTAPFGNVVITLGPKATPQSLDVISLSQMARESGTSESETVTALEAKGHRVVKPESFLAALDKLKEGVLSGAVVLPITKEQVRACLAASAPNAARACLPAPTIVAPVLRPSLLPVGWPPSGTSDDAAYTDQGVG
jgi:hypothetical protein